MKKIVTSSLLYCIALFVTNTCYSQDVIVFKNGDEINSKVLEVTSDQIRYKKWENLDGPTYSSAKSEVFMIKYKNGSKDVFNNTSISNSSSSPTNKSDFDWKFFGTWYHKKYDGINNKTTLFISKADLLGKSNDYLIDYKRIERDPGDPFFLTDGSFKEVGRLDGNSIVINSFKKLTLINEGTILMEGEEFIKRVTDDFETDRNKIQDFLTNQFAAGFPGIQVVDHLGNEIKENSQSGGDGFYHFVNAGASKFITINRTWHFNPLPKPINFFIKYVQYDEDNSATIRKDVDKMNVILKAGSTSYVSSIKLNLDKIQSKQFQISEDYFYSDNTSCGLEVPLGKFKAESNDIASSKKITPVYKGDYKDGKRDGKGLQIYEDSSIYNGDWKDDKRDGKGVQVYLNGDKYDGEWKYDKTNGIGTQIYGRRDGVTILSCTGEWKNGSADGNCEMIFVPIEGDIRLKTVSIISLKFKGICKNGKCYTGTLFTETADGTKYETEVKEGVYKKAKQIKK